MCVSPLNLFLLCLLTLVFALTVDAKRHHRSGEAVVSHKKSIFRKGNIEKPHSLKQKIVKTAAKHALKTGRKKIAHKKHDHTEKWRGNGFGPLSSIGLLYLPIVLNLL
ncbi:expressed protein [Echinococcus multilocularis]|uniref:Expressed protein n=1 Tax=Echinococcus multilocularis TaxID=6211 RepID=A0A068Y3E9_ECHMU|nr:expressed protein [Echinococcus multilocularis]